MPKFLDWMLARLTSNYRKDSDSNISKLLNIISSELDEVGDTLNVIEQYRDIDKASGATLDRIGVNLEQPRGVASDEVYRVLLKLKIYRNTSNGTIPAIVEVLHYLFKDDSPQITELYPKKERYWTNDSDLALDRDINMDLELDNNLIGEYLLAQLFGDWAENIQAGEPAAIRIDASTERVNTTGLTAQQFALVARSLVAEGIRVLTHAEGTFAFASGDAPESSELGFADVVQTTGGTLGAIYDLGDSPDLPI